MLGWALKKGLQGASGTRDAPTNSNTGEPPDTPAPIFAARAIKNAIFGESKEKDAPAPTNKKRKEPARRNTTDATSSDLKSPCKPTSILLTPGTGTARRKRVSFGHDVKSGNNAEPGSVATNPDGSRRKTTLQQALENSRSSRSKVATQNNEQTNSEQTEVPAVAIPDKTDGVDSESEWEDDVCNHDVTVDLNEPHSNSGKYWKSEFARYHDEAQSEMDKLVRYKHMAKSYAKKKDSEAINLTQRLKEEQDKVQKMEQKITEMAAEIADKRKHGTDQDNPALMNDLAKQTALAVQYRDQVKGLEAILNGQQDDADYKRSERARINTSPRTEKTLLETNRELRRLRSELRQMNGLREENQRLKSDLSASQQEAKMLAEGSKKQGTSTADTSRAQRLEKQLREVKDELRQRDSEIRRMNRDYESLKRDAKARTSEAMQVLQEKNDKIGQLEREIKTLKAEVAEVSSSRRRGIDMALAEHNKITQDMKTHMASLSRPSVNSNKQHEKPIAAARRRQPRQRSMSVEDLTLDMTQRSLFGDNIHNSDWTADLKEIEDQLRNDRVEYQEKEAAAKKKQHQRDSNGREANDFTDTLDLGGSLAATTVAPNKPKPTYHQPSSFSARRAIMSDRINESTPIDDNDEDNDYHYGSAAATAALPRDRRASSYHRGGIGATTTTATTAARASSRARDHKRATMHDTLATKPTPAGRQQHLQEQQRSISDPSATRTAAAAAATAATSIGGDDQGIDLFKDRFARLGGGGGGLNPKSEGAGTGTTTANASRCALPADRQAAARARLEQKKLERLREKERMEKEREGGMSRGRDRISSRSLVDKENLVPC
ncbi:hypothetical protein SLS62_006797 [Diatrype stigma]|uniref:Spindle pole body-associated protein cut12 domain-containing protein n=1 Tax=Diatrype stigma TaxID=117547 RepID=A0AAN9UQ49_9PEZI